MAVMELKDVRYSYDGKRNVLKKVDVEFEEGKIYAVVGPSGCGKTTLLSLLGGLDFPIEGQILYNGKKLTYDALAEHRREHIAFVFQNFNLFPHFSVMKNITDAPIVIQKRNKEEVYNEARELLKKVGIEDKENAYPCELSGGQQQRVAIARALALHPKMLYFDEPTSALDPEITAEILRVMKSLAAEKMTMAVVTHEIDFARAFSNKVVFMDGGMVIEEGKPEDVIDNPKNERTKAFLKKLHI